MAETEDLHKIRSGRSALSLGAAFALAAIVSACLYAWRHPGPGATLAVAALGCVAIVVAFVLVRRLFQQQEKQLGDIARLKHRADAASEAKSKFLAMMSHEIRTPLTAILGFTELLDESTSAAEREDTRQAIVRNGKLLLEILNDILDLSKIEAGQLKLEKIPFSPLAIVWSLDSMMGEQARSKGLAFKTVIDHPFPSVVIGDPTRWKQILLNLYSNAVKFTEEGGVEARFSYDKEASCLVCHVSDTGIGISSEQMALLFQPFSQADGELNRRYGGTGLGLHLVRRLVEKMCGEVSASSEPGRGSMFTVRIQTHATEETQWLLTEESTASSSPRASDTETYGQTHLSGRVLLADDSPDNRKLIGAFLSKLGLDFALVDNGEQAVERALDMDFDLLLMDVQMPVMDGVTATQMLRAAGFGKPIIAVTANIMPEDVARYMQSGFTHCVGKPIDFGLLTRLIAETLGQQISVKEKPLAAHELPEFQSIQKAFEDELPSRLAQLQAFAQQRNWPELRDLAHMLKGSAGSFGFPGVTEASRRIEDAVRHERFDDAVDALKQLSALEEVQALSTAGVAR